MPWMDFWRPLQRPKLHEFGGSFLVASPGFTASNLRTDSIGQAHGEFTRGKSPRGRVKNDESREVGPAIESTLDRKRDLVLYPLKAMAVFSE